MRLKDSPNPEREKIEERMSKLQMVLTMHNFRYAYFGTTDRNKVRFDRKTRCFYDPSSNTVLARLPESLDSTHTLCCFGTKLIMGPKCLIAEIFNEDKRTLASLA